MQKRKNKGRNGTRERQRNFLIGNPTFPEMTYVSQIWYKFRGEQKLPNETAKWQNWRKVKPPSETATCKVKLQNESATTLKSITTRKWVWGTLERHAPTHLRIPPMDKEWDSWTLKRSKARSMAVNTCMLIHTTTYRSTGTGF